MSAESGIQLKEKNNFTIFNEMTEDEWTEVIESELIDFLKLMQND